MEERLGSGEVVSLEGVSRLYEKSAIITNGLNR